MTNQSLSEEELLAKLPEPLYTLEQIYKFGIQDILEQLKKVQNADWKY